MPSDLQVWKAEHEGVKQELVDEGDTAAVSERTVACPVGASCCTQREVAFACVQRAVRYRQAQAAAVPASRQAAFHQHRQG